MTKIGNLKNSLKQLEASINQFKNQTIEKDLSFLLLTKAYEVAIEYSWKELKVRVEDHGLEAPSPKIAIKQAAKIGLINDPEAWIEYIILRNSSVHDYYSVSDEQFLKSSESFLEEAKKIFNLPSD